MAAGQTVYDQTSAALTKALVKKVINEKASNPTKLLGYVPFKTKSFTIAATQVDDAGDETYFIIAPPDALIGDLNLTVSDMDTGSNLEIRLQAQTAGGTETALSAATAVHSGGGTVGIQDSSKFTDISNQYIGFEVTTGAGGTAAAGTAVLSGYFICGTANHGYVKYN